MSRIYIENIGDRYDDPLERGFKYLGAGGRLRSSDRIIIKPNLTFPTFRKGVMTSVEAVESLVRYLRDYTNHITICESDSGGYNRFSMDEVFRAVGLTEVARKYDARIINLSHQPSRNIRVRTPLRRLSVPLPAEMLDGSDLFITMPVPKVHANTKVSIALKNQWGVIQQPDLRLKLHPYFKQVIYEVNRALPNPIAIVDGRYGLTENGPMRGQPVELNWLMVSDNLYYTDMAVSALIGFNWREISYLRYAFRREGIDSLDGVTCNTDISQFGVQFRLRRTLTDYPGLFTFHSRTLAYVGYESALARPLHWLLYRVREPFY